MKSKSEKDYIEQIIPRAQEAQRVFGYLASVLIAQACLENGYGLDPDCKVLMDVNNILGMKRNLLNDTWTSDYWDGRYITKLTPEWRNGKIDYINDTFRSYPDIRSCIFDYCQFMRDAKYSKNGEYKYRGVLTIKDPAELIRQVQQRGYCTDPSYPDKVMLIIKKHNLTQYDIKETKPMNHEIIDITSENKAPRSRGMNKLEWIVIHYLGVPNADNPYLYGGGFGGHYNITRDGKIYMAVNPKKGVVWHCGGGIQGEGPGAHIYHGICTNYNSIGIECGVCADTDAKDLSGDSGLWFFTTETQEACAWLVAKLMRDHNIDIDHVIRHYDVTGKTCPNPYVLNNKRRTSWTWDEFKERVKQLYTGAESVREGDYMTTFANVHKGVSGADALTVQRLLFAQGFKGADGEPLKLDGDFGANSEHALKEYQTAQGLVADGDCGPKTWEKLLGKE